MARDDGAPPPNKKKTRVGWRMKMEPPQETTYVPEGGVEEDDSTAVTKVMNDVPVAEAPKEERAYLVILYPPTLLRDEMLPVEPDGVSIGRLPTNDIVLEHESVSRVHAKIYLRDGYYVLEDVGSTNGTFVHDRRITRAVLTGGEIVRIGEVLLKFLTGSDVEAQFHELMLSMTREDVLTGAINKRVFNYELQRAFQNAVRNGSELSLLMLDIDHFKKINDRYGHLAGDLVLRELGERIRHTVPAGAIVARYGGEEFAVILPGTSRAKAMMIAENIRRAVGDSPVYTAGHPINVTISIGVAGIEELMNERDPEALIKLSDSKLYEAKKRGRNRVVV